MDTITHGLLGAVTAQLGFRQKIGRDATWAAIVGGIIPDLDIFIAPLMTLTGSEVEDFTFITTHRGITHSLLVVPFLSLATAGLWWWFRRKVYVNPPETDKAEPSTPFWLMFLCVFLAMLSHPILDVGTTYGTQLLAPLSNHRFAIDAIPIVDLIYTPILILTLLICYLIRKFKSDSRKPTLIAGWIGFGLSMLYFVAGFCLNRYVIAQMQQSQSQIVEVKAGTSDPCEYHAYPQIGTIFVWRVTRHCDHNWQVAKMNVLLGRTSIDPEKINSAKIADNQWIRQASRLPQVELFKWFALGQTRADYSQRNGDHIVDFYDMRYGLYPQSLESLWSARATYDTFTNRWTVEYVRPNRDHTMKRLASQVWRDLWTP